MLQKGDMPSFSLTAEVAALASSPLALGLPHLQLRRPRVSYEKWTDGSPNLSKGSTTSKQLNQWDYEDIHSVLLSPEQDDCFPTGTQNLLFCISLVIFRSNLKLRSFGPKCQGICQLVLIHKCIFRTNTTPRTYKTVSSNIWIYTTSSFGRKT
jgi:hypothetical protein